MKTLRESILDQNFDVTEPPVKFKGAKELADIFLKKYKWKWFKWDSLEFIHGPHEEIWYDILAIINPLVSKSHKKDYLPIRITREHPDILISTDSISILWDDEMLLDIYKTTRETRVQFQKAESTADFNRGFNYIPREVAQMIIWCMKNIKK